MITLDNFFRKDLKLHNYWWHRLSKVLFFFAVFGYAVLIVTDAYTELGKTDYKKISLFSERVNENLVPLKDVVSDLERIGSTKNSVVGSHYDGWGGYVLSKEHTYCATNIYDQIDAVSHITGVYHYKGDKDLVSLNEFKEYLIDEDAFCITSVEFGGYTLDYYGVPKALGREWFIDNNTYIWAEGRLIPYKLILMYLVEFFAIFFIVLLLYYKVFLYIAFGRRPIQ